MFKCVKSLNKLEYNGACCCVSLKYVEYQINYEVKCAE